MDVGFQVGDCVLELIHADAVFDAGALGIGQLDGVSFEVGFEPCFVGWGCHALSTLGAWGLW